MEGQADRGQDKGGSCLASRAALLLGFLLGVSIGLLVTIVAPGGQARQSDPRPGRPGRGEARQGAPGTGSHQGHGQARAAAKGPGRVRISPQRQQLIGVRTDVVKRRPLSSSIRAVGVIAYDETRVAEVHTKIAGWVDKLHVDYVGKRVRRGQPLFSIYSPDLLSAQYEYRIALGHDRQGGGGVGKGRITGSAAEAARRRLKLWDISEAQIARLARGGAPQRTLTLFSPFDGVVLERRALPGQYLEPATVAFKIGDLSRIWVSAEIFEYEARSVAVGQAAEVRFPYGQEEQPLEGRISFIYPEVDPRTRRLKVRLEFRNPGLALRPASFVTVVIRVPAGEELAVPKEAVIDTGTRQYALLALPGGYFEPRDIEVGPPGDVAYPVRKGLKEGDRVVTSAQFLVDSETNLQAAMQSMMGMHGMEPGKEGEHGHQGMPGMEGMEGGEGTEEAPPSGQHEEKKPGEKKNPPAQPAHQSGGEPSQGEGGPGQAR